MGGIAMSLRSSPAALTGAALLVVTTQLSAQPMQCMSPPPDPPPVLLSPTLPADVCLPVQFGGIPFRFFDDFSWRTFVAAVWPAAAGQRGVPDSAKVVGDVSAPLVFETYKADWEVFQPNGSVPAKWEDSGPTNPCPNVPSVTPQDLVLASFSKFGNLGQAGFGELVGPLVAQNGTYAMFLAGVNKPEFDQILANKWFLRANLNNVSFMPDAQGNNPIDVKSSWVVVKNNVPDPSRYYVRKAWVYDRASNQCTKEPVALVGLHLVTKTPLTPQWIWSTFEHVDNVPGPGATAPFAFNDGSAVPMPVRNPTGFPPPAQPPQPFNVTRLLPISSETQALNAKYQSALKASGSGVWQFYQLVATQWPVPINKPANPGTPGFTVPGTITGATTAFANTTMETFDQRRLSTSCMACHDSTGRQTDFLWALQMHAFPPAAGTNASQPQFHAMFGPPANAPLQRLKKLLLDANKANAAAQAKEKQK
jgi:hypothetical protein